MTYRGVAQLVARTAGGREVARSNRVTPTMFGLHESPRVTLPVQDLLIIIGIVFAP